MIIKGMNKELMLTFEFVTFFHRGLPTFMPAVSQLQVSQKKQFNLPGYTLNDNELFLEPCD